MNATRLYLTLPQPLESNGRPIALEGKDVLFPSDRFHEVKLNDRGEQYVQFDQMMRPDELAHRGLGGEPFSRCVMYLTGGVHPYSMGNTEGRPPLGIYNYSELGLHGEVYQTGAGWVARATGEHLGQTHDFLSEIYKKKVKPTRTWLHEYRKVDWEPRQRKTLWERIRDYFNPDPEVCWD